ncbi:protein kinase protein [Trichomonas vaginalis G3]|uniref:protein kinase protein n=1 Tax=Trichomonas vaginalis (strain ATCC PRA-98 / G3) TaxID=412133 RepID=UPI0021E609EE|nr:protein kinase protein [Trichomonas vaginalis G3]KAI5496701.1 protein kinase protein [Trichomonas vaginalis G3]
MKQATYVTAIAVANQGIELPVDLIDGIASRAFTDPFGTSVLIAACNHPTTAAHLLQMIEHGLRCPITVSARMILVASKHKELKPLLQAAVRAVPISHDQGLKNLLVRITS